ncbi:receptor kinase-like protein Xa21 [Iris pallida]|uniref:Receptor kinase-like protein Xa21 n=1 Tax=Iris pallida TaxID=29817 RepID=A0AAX6ETM1_IRIPA|nr:receptor kinase-like protein Xa21 [Iris pallida]
MFLVLIPTSQLQQLLTNVLLPFIAVVFLLYHHHHVRAAMILLPKHNNATDRSSLLVFKSALTSYPHRVLDQWNDSVHFCEWQGITCGGPRHPERVVALQLSSLDLVGIVSPDLGNLTFLRTIDLSSNHLHGHIPQELSNLPRIQIINLGSNSLSGAIPPQLGNCRNLNTIDLSHNSLQGPVPSEFGSFRSLHTLNLNSNSVTGQIPPSLANVSSLAYLDLRHNLLSGGIPPSLGKLSNLIYLYLGFNNLGGTIPPSLWNLTSLQQVSLDANGLHGSLPPDVGRALPQLTFLSIFVNHMHGPIPISLSNASDLNFIQLFENNFSGTIPRNLGSLRNLQVLELTFNQLEAREPDDWNFFTALSNCTVLSVLGLGYNNLGGFLPSSLVNLSSSSLQLLHMGGNYIQGSIPTQMGNLVGLTSLDLGPNLLTGSIPDSIGMLLNLHQIDLNTNNFSGDIPSAIGNLSQLTQLYLDFNGFSGIIPSSLGNCTSLEFLNLGYNKLTGTIPKEILTISTLSRLLSVQENLLTGTIPPEVGSLVNLGKLRLTGNKLSGEIPTSLGKCVVLQFLYLGRNLLHGSIPASLRTLRGLQELDLSQNNLSGSIPSFLKDFDYLTSLNLSFNDFEGELPTKGVFANASALSVLGNKKLCGGIPILHLAPCPFQAPKKKHKSPTPVVIISVASALVCSLILFLLVAACYWTRHKSRRKHIQNSTAKEQYINVSYAELAKATDGFSEANLIGSGEFGSVYRGKLDGGKVVAVKVFNLQNLGALKSFVAECDAFRNIRHRNLIKILTACSSVDFNGNDFKAMVFPLMANGSLESWLHPKTNDRPKNLNIIQRMNIAIDVASAVEYLHHHGQTPIIHCDLKPSNILLDDDMTAIVCDFGLVRFMKESTTTHTSSGVKGTIGYIAPEYGMSNRVSTQGDVYSYGILLLELFTGKRPTDHSFKEDLSLRTFVETALPDRVMDILDVRMLMEEENSSSDDDAPEIKGARILSCASSVLRIGLLCINDLPMERMDMKTITNELHAVRNVFISNSSTRHKSYVPTAAM